MVLMVAVVEKFEPAVVMKMPNTAIMNAPIPKRVMKLMMTLKVVMVVVSVIVTLEHRRATLTCLPGSLVLFNAGSQVVWVVGSDMNSGTGSGVLPLKPSAPPRPVEAVDKNKKTVAALLVWEFPSSRNPSAFIMQRRQTKKIMDAPAVE